MKLRDFKKKIKIFRNQVLKFQDLLNESTDDILGEIITNYKEISKYRSRLNRQYANLDEYIFIFGRNPKMNDGVWNILYSAYSNAFSSDIMNRVAPSIRAVIQDLDYIIGKIASLNEKEFQDRINIKRENKKGEKMNKNYHFNKCNVSIESSQVIQNLNIEDEEVKQKIRELETAIKEKNPSKIKKIFGYIADKAIDVAIALLVNGMGK